MLKLALDFEEIISLQVGLLQNIFLAWKYDSIEYWSYNLACMYQKYIF